MHSNNAQRMHSNQVDDELCLSHDDDDDHSHALKGHLNVANQSYIQAADIITQHCMSTSSIA